MNKTEKNKTEKKPYISLRIRILKVLAENVNPLGAEQIWEKLRESNFHTTLDACKSARCVLINAGYIAKAEKITCGHCLRLVNTYTLTPQGKTYFINRKAELCL